jgi:fructose-specific phosphotransferase system IIC component
MSFINQYSYLIAAGVVLILLGIYLIRRGVDRSSFITFGALILGLLMAFVLLRPGTSLSLKLDDVLDQIGSGQPVLLEFQSEY